MSTAFDNENIISCFTKQATLMRRSTVLNLPLQLVFPDKTGKRGSQEGGDFLPFCLLLKATILSQLFVPFSGRSIVKSARKLFSPSKLSKFTSKLFTRA
jgi:hypothetical protein